MTGSFRGPLLVVLMLGVIVALGSGAAHASSDQVTVADSTEAWYSSVPTSACGAPVGCQPGTGPSVYPANTLHVGAFAGSETERTYVNPDLSALPPGATAAAGTMTLPVSGDPAAGTQNAAGAQPVACLVTAAFADGTSGSTDQPPATDCGVTAKVAYVASAGSFSVDLTPFLDAWASGRPRLGLALLAEPTQSPAGGWHLAFNGRKMAGAPHISSTLTLTLAAEAAGAGSPGESAPAAANPAGTGEALPGGGTPEVGVAPVSPLLAAPVPVPALGPAPSPAAPPGASGDQTFRPTPAGAVLSDPGFQYPEALLLPLAFLGALAFLARTFTSDATPRSVQR